MAPLALREELRAFFRQRFVDVDDPGRRPASRTWDRGVGGNAPVPSSTNVSRRRGCTRESHPNLADIAPRLPGMPCVGPLRMEMYCRLPIAIADRRAERGGRRSKTPTRGGLRPRSTR